MKTPIILAVSLLAIPSIWSQAPSARGVQYLQIACLDRAPGATNQDVVKFFEDYELKRMQYRVNAGSISRWRLERNALPGGPDADCQYRSIAGFYDFPDYGVGTSFLESIRGAGINLTAPEYAAKRDAVVRLVRLGIYRVEGAAGSGIKKGGYTTAIMAKINPGRRSAFQNDIKDILLPYYRERVASGSLGVVLIGIDSLASPSAPYNSVIHQFHPEWKDLARETAAGLAWEKAHPGKDITREMDRIRENAPITVRNVYRIQLITVPKQPSRQTSSGQ
jgi:hypothetical protein